MEWNDKARHSITAAEHSKVRHTMVQYGTARQVTSLHVTARHGTAQHGMALHVSAVVRFVNGRCHIREFFSTKL